MGRTICSQFKPHMYLPYTTLTVVILVRHPNVIDAVAMSTSALTVGRRVEFLKKSHMLGVDTTKNQGVFPL